MFSDNVTTDSTDTAPETAPESEESSPTPDWGSMNRELLAERLREAYHKTNSQLWYYENYVKPMPVGDSWLAVADDAIDALLGGN